MPKEDHNMRSTADRIETLFREFEDVRHTDASRLNEAMSVLEELARVFFHENSKSQTPDDYPKKRKSESVISKAQSHDFETMYRILAEQIPAVVFLAYLDEGLGQAYVSPHIETVLGFSQEERLNDPVRWFNQLHPEDKDRWSIEAAQMFAWGRPLQSTYRVMARDLVPVRRANDSSR